MHAYPVVTPDRASLIVSRTQLDTVAGLRSTASALGSARISAFSFATYAAMALCCALDYDAKVAGWWVWGICTWIGSGWCHPEIRLQRRRPSLINVSGHGVHALRRQAPLTRTPGNGIHAPSRKKPLTHRNKGVHRDGKPSDLFLRLANRLRDVRVCCGDWTRVLGRSTLGIGTAHGMTPCGIVLDPPYAHELREKRMYREDDDVSAAVRVWAIEHGNNDQLRIALCGFDGEHEMPSNWTCVEWRSTGSGQNRSKEWIWFSPHCNPALAQRDLFDRAEAST